MSEEKAAARAQSAAPAKRSWKRRAAAFAVAFAISLIVGRVFETVASQPALNAALNAQSGWMAALNTFSPWGVAGTFGDQMSAQSYADSRHMALNEEGRLQYTDATGGPMNGLMLPMKALSLTVGSLITAGGVAGLVQIGLGVMGVALGLEWLKRRHKSEFGGPVMMVFWPLGVILAASLIAVALKVVMVGALGALSWATSLAAGAAGASGVVGFCWYCFQKLGEKGAEHALTPKI